MILRKAGLPYLPLILAPILLFSPTIFTRKAIFWGTPVLQFVPWRYWAWETLRSGHLPLWNPEVGMGAPLVANYQSALFYPPNWIYFLLAAAGGVPAIAWGQAVLVALHLVWAAAGMALLARHLGLNSLSQTVSGLAFGLSAYLVARAGFLSINATAAWMPWVLLACSRVSMSPYRKSSILWLATLAALQLLAGHAQVAWYTLLFAFLWSGWLAWFRRDGDSPNGKRLAGPAVSEIQDKRSQSGHWTSGFGRVARAWGALGVAWAIAGMLAAVQIFPTAEYLSQSDRASTVDFEFSMTYSFWPWRLLGLMAPGLFGNPATGDYWGYANYWEDAIYIGVLPLFLAIAAILSTGRNWLKGRTKDATRVAGEFAPSRPANPSERVEQARLVPFLGGIVLVSFVLALGKNTPIFPWLYDNIPTFGMFNAPTRFTLWAVFSLALLAGIGAQHWRRPTGRGLYWTRLGTAAGVAVAAGAGLAWILLGDISSSFIRATALAGVWVVAAGILTLAAPQLGSEAESNAEKKNRAHAVWAWAAAIILCLDLLVAGWGLNPAVELDFYRRLTSNGRIAASGIGEGRIYLSPDDERAIKFERFFRFDTFQPEEGWEDLPASLLPNLNMLAGLRSANNFDPLLPARYQAWMTALAEAGPITGERMLNLMAVEVVESIDESQAYGINYTYRQNLPRFRWVPCATYASGGEEALTSVLQGQADLERQVILEGAPPAQHPACSGDGSGEAGLVSEHPNQVVLAARGSVPGYVLLSDVYFPGWQARLDGRRVELLRANYLFRAVMVPAGEHVIEFVYRPTWFYVGLALSLLAWAGLVSTLAYHYRVLQRQSAVRTNRFGDQARVLRK